MALQSMLLPKLMAMNSLNFDFQECAFSEKMMNCKDRKDGLSREGAGRVAIYKMTELPNCYTLECHYVTAKRINTISERQDIKTGQILPEDEAVTDSNSKMYQGENKIPLYTPIIFEDVGRSFCVGLLDLVDANPLSRVATSQYKCTDGVKREVICSQHLQLPPKLKQ